MNQRAQRETSGALGARAEAALRNVSGPADVKPLRQLDDASATLMRPRKSVQIGSLVTYPLGD